MVNFMCQLDWAIRTQVNIIKHYSGGVWMRLVFVFFFLFACLFGHTWDFSSLTRDQTRAPAVEARSLNHWTAREVPRLAFELVD